MGTNKRLKSSSILFSTAQDNNTITHIAANAEFFQIELGIRAGLPCASWCCIQKMKASIIAVAMHRSIMLEVSRTLTKLPVIILYSK
jgi:hypothetical protein